MSKVRDSVEDLRTVVVEDSSGNVGIGTSTVLGTAAGRGALTLSGSTSSFLNFGTGSTRWGGVYSDATKTVFLSDNLATFEAGNVERMRLDSSGNLLVGKTATSFGAAGIEARSGGTLWATASGTNAASFNRLLTDGPIAYFSKDGTTVGSIGTNAETLYVSAPQAGGMKYTYLNATNAVMMPVTTTGANADAVHDLGYSAARFKDLYLSGGVYLGGTAAANTLDDYEEGTWTPVLSRGGSPATISFGTTSRYTKIGRLVTVTVYISAISNFPTTGGTAVITGMPFAANGWHTGNIGYASATNCSNTSWVLDGSIGYFLTTDNANFISTSIDLNRGMFTVTYQTA